MVSDRDVARGVRAERRAERVTRIYATLAKSYEAIVRIRQRLPLFEQVCRVLVEEGRLRMAWVGEIDDRGWIVPVAHAGAVQGYLDDLRVSVLDVPEGRGPTGIAARERHHMFTTDIATDERMAPWRDAALARGFRSSAGFPLVVHDRCVAVLTAYASEPGFFDEEEVVLFDRMAADLSFALEAMQREERRRAVEAQLHASEERFHTAVESMLDAFMVVSPVRDDGGEIVDFRYAYVNDAFCALVGVGREQLLGHRVGEVFPGFVGSARFEAYHRVAVTGEPCRTEDAADPDVWPGTALAGHVVDVSIVATGEDLVVSARDVSDRRRIEVQLGASEERYRRALSALSEGIVVQGKDGAISSCNPAAERILGLNTDQMMGVSSLDPRWRAIHEDGSPFPGEEHPAMVTLRTGTPLGGVIMGVHKPDGSLSWISINSMPFRAGSDSAGEDAVVTTFTDITARRAAEARLRESEERFQAAIGSMRDAVAIQSPVRDESGEIVDFRYDYANDAHSEVVGRDREQLLGRGVGEVFPGWSRSARFAIYRQVMLTGTPFRTEDFNPERAWGAELARRVLDSVVARAGERLVVSARDVTDRRRAEAQLRASEERFDAAVGSMLDAFAIISPVRDEQGEVVDFRWEYVNDAYCTLVELDRDQLIGNRLSERYPGWPSSERLVVYRRVSETGEPCLSVDVAEPEAWAGGRLANRVLDTMIVAAGENVVVTARDVTERHRLEEQLRASEELFRTGVGSLLDGFTICSPVRDETGEIIDFRWEYANDAACARNELAREQMLGHRISEVLPGYTDTDVFKLHRRVAQTGEPARVDEVSWHGEWVAGRQVDRAYDGSVVPLGPNIVVTGRDVTNARRNERELRLQAELLELAHDAVIVRDPVESRVTFWNREAEAIYGYSRQEALGVVTHELLATVFPESREAIDDALARDGRWVGELSHTRKDGDLIVVSSRQALQRDADGRPIAIIELNSDITERKRAEEELARIAGVLERTERISSTGGWEYDVATGELTWTDEVYRIYGVERTSDPTVVTEAIAAYDPESATIIDAAFKRLVAEGEPYDLELGLVRADGQRIWVRTIGRPVIEDGRIVRVGGNISDVSERKRVEQALRASDQLFHSGFDHSPIGMALTGLDGRLVEVNAAFAEMLGLDDPAQLAGEDVARLTHPDDLAATREGIRIMVQDGKPFVAEKRYIRRDGAVVHGLVGSTAVLDSDGRPSMLYTQVQDITQRKQAEAALRASEERFRGGFENSPIGMALVGLDGRFVEVNSTLARMLGYDDPSELAGQSFTNIVDPDHVALGEAARQRIIEAGTVHGERRYVRTDGTSVYALYGATLVRDGDGQPSVIFAQVEDITERRQAEEEIRTLNVELEQRVAARTAELERANKELETFAYSVSHDLRAPLRAIEGFSQALLEDYSEKLDEQGRHDLERVRAGAVRMGDLIDALLQLSRLSRWRLARVRIDISALAREVVAELQGEWPDRHVEVEIQDGLLAEADLRLVRTVLQNLLANAYKFTAKAAHPRIRFGAVQQDGVCVYFVADNGAGFDMAHAERLFLPFHRLHRETEFPGDGIGLATVTRAVRKHGGAIWAQGAVNEGATFQFSLTPGAQPPASAAAGQDVLPTWQPTERERRQ